MTFLPQKEYSWMTFLPRKGPFQKEPDIKLQFARSSQFNIWPTWINLNYLRGRNVCCRSGHSAKFDISPESWITNSLRIDQDFPKNLGSQITTELVQNCPKILDHKLPQDWSRFSPEFWITNSLRIDPDLPPEALITNCLPNISCNVIFCFRNKYVTNQEQILNHPPMRISVFSSS